MCNHIQENRLNACIKPPPPDKSEYFPILGTGSPYSGGEFRSTIKI